MRSKAYHTKIIKDDRGNQFLSFDFRLFEIPTFGKFTRSSAFAVYLLLLRNVWRSPNQHNRKVVNQLFEDGRLVTAMPRETLAEKLGLKPGRVSHLLTVLVQKGVIKRIEDAPGIFAVGTWTYASQFGNPQKKVESYYITQSEVVTGVPSEKSAKSPKPSSAVAKKRPPEVSKRTHSNREDKNNNKYYSSSDQESGHAVIHVRI